MADAPSSHRPPLAILGSYASSDDKILSIFFSYTGSLPSICTSSPFLLPRSRKIKEGLFAPFNPSSSLPPRASIDGLFSPFSTRETGHFLPLTGYATVSFPCIGLLLKNQAFAGDCSFSLFSRRSRATDSRYSFERR